MKSIFGSEKIQQIIPSKKSVEWLNQILVQFKNQFQADDYVTLEHFLDGKGQGVKDVDQIISHLADKKFESIDCSFRLTNVQRLSPEVNKMCLELEKKFQNEVTCNLYFTPGLKKNCFSFHADPQDVWVVQLSGSKRWYFLKENDGYVKNISLGGFKSDKHEQYEKTFIELHPEDQLHVPYSVVHSAEIISADPSIHLTFSTNVNQVVNLVRFFMEHSLTETEFDENVLNAELPKNEALIVLNKLVKSITEANLEDVANKFAKKVFLESVEYRKFGRPYKKKNKPNQNND